MHDREAFKVIIYRNKSSVSVVVHGLGLLVLEVDAVKPDVDSSFIVGASVTSKDEVVDVFGLDVLTGVVVGGIVTSISRKIILLQN